MAATHQYRTQLSWAGSTGSGYRGYSREHRLDIADQHLTTSADRSFLGDPARPNPEQLLLAAASSCQLLSFLALAARDGLDVRSYDDDAEARMPVTRERMRITQIVLRPHVALGPGADPAQVTRLLHSAHDECYVANTVTADIVLEPRIEIADA